VEFLNHRGASSSGIIQRRYRPALSTGVIEGAAFGGRRVTAFELIRM
jgi:hypothetical protein